MSQVALVVKTFVNPDGTPVNSGYIRVRLSQDGSVNNSQIQANFVTLALDSLGTIVGSPLFWTNGSISPSGTYYIQEVYSATGQLVSGPTKVTV